MLVLWSSVAVTGCAARAPANTEDACAIFREKRGWFDDCRDAYERWGVPISVQLAIVHQESRFQAKARPPRRKILWIFPGPRPSSAFGYSQALDGTWDEYRKNGGRRGADRDVRLGWELGAVLDSVSFQSELILASAHGPDEVGSPLFPAAYLMCSWIPTGEHRSYRRNIGVFGRVHPKRKTGAVEIMNGTNVIMKGPPCESSFHRAPSSASSPAAHRPS